jgi:EAL domain-containing protein (putative c-di-GMP-specific phosphodiesterase class I)
MMSEPGERESIEAAVAGLLREISQPIDIDGLPVQLQASIGISLCPYDGRTYEELLRSAYSAMNQARLAGGNTSRFFDKSISQREERQATLRQGIRAGLLRHEFYMLYQPKFSLSKQRVVGAEALVRWNHPDFGLVAPVEFIPLAETSGAIIDMSVWIINTVCAQLSRWRHQQRPQVPVSINISPVHFWRGDLIGALRSGVDKWDIPPEMLPIEVTEGIVMDASEKTMQLLGELKAMGFHLSIDDFGTGYSSLKYLRDLPVSELKIDRSFIIDIPEANQPDDLSRTAIPRAIIKLAAELDLTVVAEGVETEHQKNFLVENGCDVIQGYLFSRPVAADEFALLLS